MTLSSVGVQGEVTIFPDDKDIDIPPFLSIICPWTDKIHVCFGKVILDGLFQEWNKLVFYSHLRAPFWPFILIFMARQKHPKHFSMISNRCWQHKKGKRMQRLLGDHSIRDIHQNQISEGCRTEAPGTGGKTAGSPYSRSEKFFLLPWTLTGLRVKRRPLSSSFHLFSKLQRGRQQAGYYFTCRGRGSGIWPSSLLVVEWTNVSVYLSGSVSIYLSAIEHSVENIPARFNGYFTPLMNRTYTI